MPKIVISYRRDDTAGVTGRLYDRLLAEFGDDAIFRDIDSIPAGLDFRRHIEAVLEQTDILLCIIGPRWTGKRRWRRSRIREPSDPVRIELETALRRGVPVIPVLVDDTPVPSASELPDTLQSLRYRNAVTVSQLRDFNVHAHRLIDGIRKTLLQPEPVEIVRPDKPVGIVSRLARDVRLASAFFVGSGFCVFLVDYFLVKNAETAFDIITSIIWSVGLPLFILTTPLLFENPVVPIVFASVGLTLYLIFNGVAIFGFTYFLQGQAKRWDVAIGLLVTSTMMTLSCLWLVVGLAKRKKS
jgi:TIR domain